MRIDSTIGPKKQIGRVVSKVEIAEKVFEIEISLPELLLFKPGQYVSLKVSEQGLRRSYSVVDYVGGVIKLIVDVGPGGLGSVFLENIKVGDDLEVMGFFGNFLLDRTEVENKSVVYFVATGTGIAPFIPMIKKLKSFYAGKVVLWWGVRFVRRVYWQDELKKLKEDWDNFDHEMYVSRPEAEWNGKVGRVGDTLDSVSAENASWYLCGATEMVEQMKERLRNMGVNEDNINYEKFF